MAVYQPRVLIVDDQPGIRRLLAEVFESKGYTVLVAANGYDGVQIACETKPDVILMDMKMPGMNGVDALKEIQRQGHSGKVIMMTAYGEVDTIKEIMAAGAREYITKPFDISMLYELIDDMVGARGREQQAQMLIS